MRIQREFCEIQRFIRDWSLSMPPIQNKGLLSGRINTGSLLLVLLSDLILVFMKSE
jgi:hypothetical protein